jgi:hypothetical protein
VAFLLTCAPLGRAVVNFGDDESSDLTSNREGSLWGNSRIAFVLGDW